MAKCEVVDYNCEAAPAYRGFHGTYTVDGEHAQYKCYRCGVRCCGNCSTLRVLNPPRIDKRKHRLCANCAESED